MALVAYGSSDSESDYEDIQEDSTPPVQSVKSFLPAEASSSKPEIPASSSSSSKRIPNSFDDFLESTDLDQDLKFNLPAPKLTKSPVSNNGMTEVDDDEFLAKKPIATEKPPPPVKPPKKSSSSKIQIVLPALSTFGNGPRKVETTLAGPIKPVGGSLLDMLPKPKQSIAPAKKRITATTTSMVPDSLTRRPAPKVVQKSKPSSHSDDSDDGGANDNEDFFSLNADDKLPEVNLNEINAMVASRSAAINQKAKRHIAEMEAAAECRRAEAEAAAEAAVAEQRDQQAISALCGTRGAKRSKRDDIEIIELSGDQLNPNREEWLRTQLQATTEYQPRGLVDTAEPGTGTKRKHQITYLAHQAKANEQELQAMWATNRHARRQTQNKYGF